MNRLLLFGSFLLAFAFSSCLKGEEYPPEPVLRFKSIRTTPDSAILSFEFTDGDGNFGLRQEDTSGAFDDCVRRYNLFCEYYELRNGQWVHVEIDPCENPNSVPFYYRVPLVEPTGQFKAQKGEIRVVITPFYYLPGGFDTCRFEARVMDRAFTTSNTVRTALFTKPG